MSEQDNDLPEAAPAEVPAAAEQNPAQISGQNPEQAAPTTDVPPPPPENAAPVNPDDVITVPAGEGTPKALPQKFALSPEQEANEMNNNHMKFANDVQNGFIQPKTYQKLFEDQNFGGKIGTLFGLLVAGAGSGLTHQPNAVLDMMDKQIERDLAAQKANQTNKQNWYNLMVQHTHNEAANKLLAAQTLGAEQTAYGTSLDNVKRGVDVDFARKALGDAKVADTYATNDAMNHMQIVKDDIMRSFINRMPNGPAKDAALANFTNVIQPRTAATIAKNNLETVKKTDAIDTIAQAKKGKGGKGNSELNPGEIRPVLNTAAFNQGSITGDNMEKHGGIANPALGQVRPEHKKQITDEAAEMQKNRNGYGLYTGTFKNLNELAGGGQRPVGAIAGAAAATAGSFLGPIAAGIGAKAGSDIGDKVETLFEKERTAAKGNLAKSLGMSEEEADKILPGFSDTEATKKQKWETAAAMFKAKENFQMPQLYKGMFAPFPQYKYPAQSKALETTKQEPAAQAPAKKSPMWQKK